MKYISQFNESATEKKYYVHIIRNDDMGDFTTEIFESKEDMMSSFTLEIINNITDIYSNLEELDEGYSIIDDLLYVSTDIEDLIDEYNEFCKESELNETHYYSESNIKNPVKSREQVIQEYELNRDKQKYNL